MASSSRIRIPRLRNISESHVHIQARRCFASSSYARDHYQTLQIPRSANRQQIKAQFYRLSKEYHPDVKAGNEARFKAVSEAYATLGNVDARRAYDNSLTSSSSQYGGPSYSSSSSSSSSSSHHPYYYQDIETGSTRRARANYAWEYTRRTNPRYNGRQNPFASSHNPFDHSHDQDSHFDRMQARAAWRASNLSSGMRRRMMEESEKIAKEENLRNTSGIGRAFQAMAMFFGVLWVAGSLRASAWEEDDLDERRESVAFKRVARIIEEAPVESEAIDLLD